MPLRIPQTIKLCLISLVFTISQTLPAEEVLILGNESMPFNGIVNGKNAGMTYEILEEATKHGAPKFTYQLGLPWKRAQQLLQNAGDLPTAIVPFTRTQEREANHLWIAKLISYQTRLSTTDKSKNLSIETLKKQPVGIIRGSAHIPLLEKLGFERISIVNKAIYNASKLSAGRVYSIAESQYVDTFNWKQAGYKVQELQFIPIGEPKHIYIAGNLQFLPEIASQIAVAIDKMEKNGSLQAIVSRWDGEL